MKLSIYVAAPFEDAGVVRVIHDRIRREGMNATSEWAEQATGAEDFARFLPSQLCTFAQDNDRDLRACNVVLVLARHGAGGEMFSEARVALEWGRAAIWVGRRTLSAWRPNVVRADSLDDAFAALAKMRVAYAAGHRDGRLLTCAALATEAA